MPSLPQDSPAAGVGTGFPMVRGPPSDLMGFYVTTYEAAFGKRPSGSPQKYEGGRVLGIEPPSDSSVYPLLGVHTGSGYVTNNYAAVSSLISPYVERQDIDMSTTSEDFKLFGHPDYQRLLPESVDEPGCQYPTDFSFSRRRFEEARIPKASRKCDTWSGCTSPAQPDVPQRTTELSGFAGTAQSDFNLPENPLEANGGRMDFFPSMCSPPQPVMGHPPPFAPPELEVGPKGVTTRKVGAAMSPVPIPFPVGTTPPTHSIPQEPLSYTTVHNQYLTNLSPLAPVAPGWWAQAPITWAPRSVEGIQMPRPSGFSTNNHPTSLWCIDKPLM